MVERPIQHEAQPSAVWVSRPQPARVPISHVLNFKPMTFPGLACHYRMRTRTFDIGHTARFAQ